MSNSNPTGIGRQGVQACAEEVEAGYHESAPTGERAPEKLTIKAFLADVFVCAPGTVLYAANVACDIGFRIVQVVSPFAQFAGGVSDRDIVVALRALFFAQTAL